MTKSCFGGCKGGAEPDQNQSWDVVLPVGVQDLSLQCPTWSGFNSCSESRSLG